MWVTLFMMLLSYFMQKKSGASNTKAMVTAGVVGAGTFYVTHETEWGRANLGALDGVTTTTPGAKPVLNADGTQAVDPATGKPLFMPGPTGNGTNGWDVLKSWGGAGTATVLGTAAAASGTGIFKNPLVVIGGLVLGVILLGGH